MSASSHLSSPLNTGRNNLRQSSTVKKGERCKPTPFLGGIFFLPSIALIDSGGCPHLRGRTCARLFRGARLIWCPIVVSIAFVLTSDCETRIYKQRAHPRL